MVGDVPTAIAVLRRAADHAHEPVRRYLVDLLVPLLVSTDQLDDAARYVASEPDVGEEMEAVYLAARSVIAARRGDDHGSAQYGADAVAAARLVDEPFMVARVLQRVSLAAFFRSDYTAAQELALESARTYERIESHRNAAHAYTVLYAIAHAVIGSPDVARLYATRIATNAERGGDVSLQHLGLVAQMEMAAEAADDRRLNSLRTRLLANPLNEQFRERFAFVVSEVLASFWVGRFDAAQATLLNLRGGESRSRPERALCDAMLALCAVALWNLDDVRRYVRSAFSTTAEHADPESIFDARRRQVARLMAAAASVLTGDAARGYRSLSHRFDPNGLFARIISAGGMDERQTPELLLGYARAVNAVASAAAANRPKAGLTPAELQILRALPSGTTINRIASDFGKSPKTVERQVQSIYGKLHVSNRAQAVQRARELGIYA
ncbi:MAG TPA: LuxR C-terminal-related transcriptional regulator [Candidatus Elarobacter sp.]|nr:LuxR C-terminal-related transcriptional regulator [Candidatus Elarobacter sp.]